MLSILSKVLSFFGTTAFKSLASEIREAYESKLRAQTTEAKLEADETIKRLEAHRDVLLAEQKRGMTSWIRPAFASLVLIYWAKLIVWDTVLGWGSTPYPGDHVAWFVTLIPSVYFMVRPFDRR